jgi:hypothetical protein
VTTRNQKIADILERVLWTLLQAGVGEAVVQSANISQLWVAPVAALLAAVKSAVATAVSKNGTAATLPESLDSSAGRHEA